MKKFWAVFGIVIALGIVLLLFLTISVLFLVMGKHLMPGAEEVAIVNIVGEINHSKSVVDLLHEYEKRPRVKAIVLRIDSPGGGVAATQEIYEEVNKIREKGEKPIIASLGSVAASGGYYVACGAEKIVANPGTLTGSIGVLINIVNMEELLKKIGIDMKTITSGELKDIGSISRELTPGEEKLLRGIIDNIHSQFLRVIEERRGLTEKELASIADARIFTGEQALKKRLIDELGNLSDAIEIAARAAGIEGEPRIVEEKKRFSLLQLILGKTELSLPPLQVRYGIQ
jgi:protease-4